MRQLSELDASFLYLESETTPMHIGGVYLFDASEPGMGQSVSTFQIEIVLEEPVAL